MVAGDSAKEKGEGMAMGMGFPLGVMEMCWNEIVGIVTRPCVPKKGMFKG